MRGLWLLLAMGVVAMGKAQTICIDPGHVSDQSAGTRGHRLTEVHANWLVGKALREKLEGLGYRVVMTKTRESQVVSNRRRAEIANEAHADLMVRLHCDAASGTGFAVYVPTRRGTAPDGHTGPEKNVIRDSGRLGKLFHRGLAKALAGELRDNGLKSDLATAIGGRQGALTGSVYSKVPVVLIEMVVLTNRRDEAFLSSETGRAKMAEALARAIAEAVPIQH